jgi:adenylate cyclase
VASASVPEFFEAELWGEPPSLSAADVASEIGCDENQVRRVWRLLGFPDPERRATFFPADVEFLRIQAEGDAVFGTASMEHLTRALGAGTRNIMEAVMALVPETFGDLAELPAAEASLIASGATHLLNRGIDTLPALLRHQARETLRFISTGDLGGLERTMTVAFCDLVGSTQMTNDSPIATGQAITAFETHAAEEIAQRGGRVVKFVGDEVMFATSELDDAHDIAIALLRWVADHDHLSLARAGIARGSVAYRDGDLYGTTVNLAARLAGLAEPDTIVVADDTANTTVYVRGFADPVRIRTTRRV